MNSSSLGFIIVECVAGTLKMDCSARLIARPRKIQRHFSGLSILFPFDVIDYLLIVFMFFCQLITKLRNQMMLHTHLYKSDHVGNILFVCLMCMKCSLALKDQKR